MASRSSGIGVVAIILGCGGVAAQVAETPKAITRQEERAMIQKALENSPAFAEAIKGKQKVVASTMVRYKDKPQGAATESDFVESLHFEYDTGKTIRTIYNLTDKKVVKIEKLEAYPTPLADEEVGQAKSLAAEKNDKVQALFRKYKEDQIEVSALAPVIADRNNKRFGKRLAILLLTPKEKLADAVSVTVNLTDKTVSLE
jgi:hypothetical protein